MREWEFTSRARKDLFEIWNYIAQDNPEAANRVGRAIILACELVSNSPFAGKVRGSGVFAAAILVGATLR
jgi:plasmid stabilization system protein ParE